MAITEPVPVIVIGKTQRIFNAVREAYLPEIEVVEFFQSQEAISAGLADALNKPKGKKPVAVHVGGGFTPAEVEEARANPGVLTVPWMHVLNKEAGEPADPVAFAADVGRRAKKELEERGVKAGHVTGAGELWLF